MKAAAGRVGKKGPGWRLERIGVVRILRLVRSLLFPFRCFWSGDEVPCRRNWGLGGRCCCFGPSYYSIYYWGPALHSLPPPSRGGKPLGGPRDFSPPGGGPRGGGEKKEAEREAKLRGDSKGRILRVA